MSDGWQGFFEGVSEGVPRGLQYRRQFELDREGVRRRRRQDEIADILLANQQREHNIRLAEAGYRIRPTVTPRIDTSFKSFGPGPTPEAPRPTFDKPAGTRTLDIGPGDKGRRFMTLPGVPPAIQGPGPGGPGGQPVPDIDPDRAIRFGGDLEYVGSPREQGRVARSRAIGDQIARISGQPIDDVAAEAISMGELDPSVFFRQTPAEAHRRALELAAARRRAGPGYRPPRPREFKPEDIRGALELVGEHYPDITDPDEQYDAAISILKGERPKRTPKPRAPGAPADQAGADEPGWLSRAYDNFLRMGGRAINPRAGGLVPEDTASAPDAYAGPHTRAGMPAPDEEMEPGEADEASARMAQLDDLAIEMADYTHLTRSQLVTILTSEGLSDEEVEYVLAQLGDNIPDDNEP